MHPYTWEALFWWLVILIVVVLFLRLFLSKDLRKRSISVALFCLLYALLVPDLYSLLILMAGVFFSVIYLLVLIIMSLRKG